MAEVPGTLLTIKQVRERIPFSANYIRELVRTGKLRGGKLSEPLGVWLIDESSVEELRCRIVGGIPTISDKALEREVEQARRNRRLRRQRRSN